MSCKGICVAVRRQIRRGYTRFRVSRRLASLCVIFVGLVFVIRQILWTNYIYEAPEFSDDLPKILWWTPFISNELGYVRSCDGGLSCYVTENKSYFYNYLNSVTHKRVEPDSLGPKRENLGALLFYGSDFDIKNLPLPRLPDKVLWGLIHEESPRNNPMFIHEGTLQLFNFSSTFSRYSDVPLTLLDLWSVDELLGSKYLTPTAEKTRLMEEEGYAPVLYIQSNCDTANDRDLYVSELMKHVKVDSYGSCLNNRALPPTLSNKQEGAHVGELQNPEFLSFVGRYKFTIAFENAVCYDYVTEKLWRPLTVGSVPIYYGSPTFKDWLPHPDSAISILDFATPRDLANHIKGLTMDDARYDALLKHKYGEGERISNERLRRELEKRWSPERRNFESYLRDFECFACRRLHAKGEPPVTVEPNSYDCPLPRNPLTGDPAVQNVWYERYLVDKCASKLLLFYVTSNMSVYQEETFDRRKMDMYDRNQC